MNEPPQPSPSARAKGRRAFVAVRNLQRRHSVDRSRLSSFLGGVVSEVGAKAGPATLALVNDDRIRELNREFRGRDEATDVLSFSGGPDDALPGSESYLGDIVISVETAERQARRLGESLVRRLQVLALHGYLHLLGYDHETDRGEMRRIEYRLRRKFGIVRRGKRAGRR